MDISGGKHVIKLDNIAELITIKLDYKKSKFKVQSERYVNKYVMRALDDFSREEMEAHERIEQVTIAKIKRKRQAAKTTIGDDLQKGVTKKLGFGKLEEQLAKGKALAEAGAFLRSFYAVFVLFCSVFIVCFVLKMLVITGMSTRMGKQVGGHVNKLIRRKEVAICI